MSTPQQYIPVTFARPWRIRRPYLYRYLEKEHVNRFFNEGILRISSFAAFGKHPDEERMDDKEGSGVVMHTNSEGTGQTIMARIDQGSNAYILCGATAFSEELKDAFARDSGFRINDTTSFADAVAHHIPGFRGGVEGSCLYLDNRTVSRNLGHIDLDQFKSQPNSSNLDMGKLGGLLQTIADDDLCFTKPLKYAHQNEYRLIWFVPANVAGHIDIRCPEAANFCTRFEELFSEHHQVSLNKTTPPA